MATDTLKTEEEVELALYELGEVERERVRLKTERDELVARAKEAARQDDKPLSKRSSRLKAALKKYTKGKLRTWEKKGSRSRQFHNGTLGFRRADKIEVPKDEAAFIVRLEQLGLTDCVKVLKQVDLEALGQYADDVIESAGAKRVTKDHFQVHPKLRTDAGAPGEA